MTTIAIQLCNRQATYAPDLTKAAIFYEKAAVKPKENWLYLDRGQDVKTPLLPDDHIILHGGERIVAGDASMEGGTNPEVHPPIIPTLNDGKLEHGLTKAKITGAQLSRLDKDLETSRLFAKLPHIDICIPNDMTLIIQDTDCYFTVPASEDDAIDLEECARYERTPPRGQPFYLVKIDGEKYRFSKQVVTGEELLSTVEKTYDDWSLNRKFLNGRRRAIAKDTDVDLTDFGIERFETIRKQAQQG